MSAPFPAPPESGIQVLAIIITLPASPSVSYYLSTHGFTTGPSDSVPNTFFDGRIGNEPVYTRRVGCVYWGNRKSESGIGSIDLINTDGEFDALAAADVRDSQVLMYRGTLGTAFSTWVQVALAIVDRIDLIGETVARVILFDRSALLDRPLQPTLYTASGGNPSLAGRPKPICYGVVYSCPIPQASSALLIYDCNDRAFQSAQLVRDSGIPLSGPSLSPNGWQYDSSPSYNGIQLTANPAGQIIADLFGGLSIGSPTVLIERLPEVISLLTITHGPLVAADLDSTSINALDAATQYPLGDWIDTPRSIADSLDNVMQSFGGWWYFDRLGKLRVGRLGNTDTARYQFGETEIVGQINVELDRATGLSDQCLGAANYFVHADSDLAGGVSEADKALLTSEYRLTALSATPLARTYLQAADGGYVANAGSESSSSRRRSIAGIPTLITEADALQAQADKAGDLYGTARYFWSFSAVMSLADLLTIEPGDRIELYLPIIRRFGLGSIKTMEVVSIEFSFVSNLVRFVCSGGPPIADSIVESGSGEAFTWGDGTEIEWSA